MQEPIRIPFRLKILATVLFLVTAVVSGITFTMAHMFHADKSAYVSDLASAIAVHAAEEANVVLSGCRDRLLELGRVLDDPNVTPGRRTALMEEMFSGMRGFVAVRFFEAGVEVGALVDTLALQGAGLESAGYVTLLRERVLPLEAVPRGGAFVSNATVSPKLPALRLAVACPRAPGRPPLVLAGVLDLDRTLSLRRSSRAFEVFLVDAEKRVVSHGDPTLVASNARLDWVPKVEQGSVAMVKVYKRGDVEMIGGFAPVGFADLLAGAQIPRSVAYFASRRLLANLLFAALVMLLLAALTSLVWSARITRSLTQLAQAAQVIGHGDFGVQVSVQSRDEMGQLAASFNQMASELRARDEALRQAQAQLLQSEKMAAFGQLGAGIAHEVKNPLAGILGLIQLNLRSVAPGDAVRATFETLERETKRCRSIIDNLLRFARQEKVQREPTALGGVVADTVALLHHQMSLHGVELRTRVPDRLPPIWASANQLQQVLMNLLMNAEQAMEGRGQGLVEISATAKRGLVELRVSDDGPGIPEHVQARIFEPFFTTKPAGKGTGLGLSVTFGIVRDHGGTIHVESEEGRGATFVIRLPVAAEALAATPAAAGAHAA